MDWRRRVSNLVYWCVLAGLHGEAFGEETIMRNTMLALLALLASAMATIGGSTPAAAYDYPWCVYGGSLGFSGDCSYTTREQCLASASGIWNRYCDVNRRLLFEKQARDQQGAPPRRGQRREY